MLNEGQKKVATAYAVVQLGIWAKSLAFYLLYGRGKVMLFSVNEFPPEARFFDYWFHIAGHIVIAVLALLFGMRTEKIEAKKFVAVIVAAVALHNFAYWLTRAHPSALYSVRDFFVDSVLLSAFILAGFLMKNIMWKK